MNIVRTGLRGVVAIGAVMLLVATIGAGAATSGTAPLTNPKHFFWAPGQNPNASTTANSLQNDLIYHGGNAGPGAMGVEQKPAVYRVLLCCHPSQPMGSVDVVLLDAQQGS